MTKNNFEDEKQQIVRGMLQLAVLVELEGGRRYGAQLLLSLSTTAFSSKVGTLYPLLNRMEKGGLIRSKWETAESQTPRRYYELTAQGRAKLELYRGFLAELTNYVKGKKR